MDGYFKNPQKFLLGYFSSISISISSVSYNGAKTQKHLNQVVFNYSALLFPQWQQYITDFCDYRLNKSYFISVLHCKPSLDLLICSFFLRSS